MSAPVAIPAAVTAGQTQAAGNAWAQANATPATGFEALLAALFPTAPAGLNGQAKGLGLIKDPTQAATEPKTDAAAEADAAASAVQAQLAALLAAQPVQVQQTAATPTADPDAFKKPAATGAAAQALTAAATPDVPEQPLVQPAAQNDAKSQAAPAAQLSIPTAPETPAAPKAATAQTVAAPAAPAPEAPLVQPAAEPKAPPPAAVIAALPLAELPEEPAPEAPAAPAVTAAVASAEAKPAAKADKPEAPVPARAAAAPAATASAQPIQAETAAAVTPAQQGADSRGDQPPPDQHEAASTDKGAPDIVAAPTAGPASAAHMIQAEAAATAARGAPETVAKLAAQIVKKLEGKTSRFDIALDPAGLGKVDVKVEINAQGQMTAALNFDTAAAAAELRGRASELRAALEQAGFDMSQSNLSFSFAGQQDNSGSSAQRDGRQGGARFLNALADDQPVAGPVSTPSLLGARTSGVDVRI